MKTLIVYAHLIAACLAVGNLLMQDLAILRFKGNPLTFFAKESLRQSAFIMICSLVLLWCTGLALVLLGYMEDPTRYLNNQKLWAKISVVVLLTINGIALHFYSFPRVVSPIGIIGLSLPQQTIVALTGVVSSVSWLYACYLGIARNWNYTQGYWSIMAFYTIFMIIGFYIASEVLKGFKKTELVALNQKNSQVG